MLMTEPDSRPEINYRKSMILSTHAVVGGAIASLLPSHPELAITAAFASHFVIDAIPHWDYPLRSIVVGPGQKTKLAISKPLLRDIVVIAMDGCVGLVLALALFAPPATLSTVALCAIAAMLPDPLQFAHSLYPREPLKTLQRFHRWMHTRRQLKWPIGVASQIALVAAVATATLAIS